MGGNEIEAAIAALAKDFAEAGRIIDVDRAAFGLSLAYPESFLTTEEIRLLIIAAAHHCGTAILAEGTTSGSSRGAAPRATTSIKNPGRRSPLQPRPRPRRGAGHAAEDLGLAPGN
jgi:hypothetical protein